MDKLNHLVVFSLDDRRFAVLLSTVVRIERMVALTPLPKAPDIVTGIINFHGQFIPVVDIRSRFNMPPRPSELSDQLLIIQTGERMIALSSISWMASSTHLRISARMRDRCFPSWNM
jgi:purine-binding chemotaxis protein CheW